MCLYSGSHWVIDGLDVILPSDTHQYTVDHYIQFYLDSNEWSGGRVAPTHVESVFHCRTHGQHAYPFLIIQLKHGPSRQRVLLKLQGFQDPPIRSCPYDAPLQREDSEEASAITVAAIGQSVQKLVGTRRYDVYHTMKFREYAVCIEGLLVLVDLATEWEHTRLCPKSHASPIREPTRATRAQL
ncbi:hypothetical protein B0H16DRAFT_1734111 [Mycena metata]|uniref:Uncharacterized protein n=1 Tax=Mycena metata TaxID=1033252 RepID=A0AAD7HWE5_9AGAR|nr:hypothetical protein B0H16DRAFT_1734111 [Mycena metata]